MERRDVIVATLLGFVAAACAWLFDLQYSRIAESGLTLSSIVLAVYIAAIVGLINTDLAKKMKREPAPKRGDKSQLGVLTTYFKCATFFTVATIVISSVLLLFPKIDEPTAIQVRVLSWLSTTGIVFYVENLLFLIITIRFMLNRQIWDD